MNRVFIEELPSLYKQKIKISGWIYRYRPLAKTAFIILKDCSGTVQCVADPKIINDHNLKLDDVVELIGSSRAEPRSKQGFEFDIEEVRVLNRSAHNLPFNSNVDLSDIGQDIILTHRPLSLRNEKINGIFQIQAEIVQSFRDFLRSRKFTEIITSKIVSGGTEGGTNLFELKYFERSAYLAQSPQFYKEYGVAGFERVFETGHVYRAEPHATSRHLTEYYSLDLEMGFIESVEEIIQLERELLTFIFGRLNEKYFSIFENFQMPKLPNMMQVPIWSFETCLEKLKNKFNRNDLIDDLDPEAERQLCKLAEEETGVASVFVLGFPLSARPFYTQPGSEKNCSASFDLLFRGQEITTGGKRLHTRESLEDALKARQISPALFEDHLQMFTLGMPPHGGLAIGLERLTALILGLQNLREATMYPRDRNRIVP
ncbi:MAG: aspartate--tRNA(Asn) ligase [Oligoflexia bacterium]|nr:aspartate--tRNA(Asn) ligase [Oligoflexia bacterium]